MQSFKCLSESSGITSEIQVPLSLPPPIIPFLQIGSIHFHPQGCNELGEPFPLLTKELSLYTGWGVSARTSTHLPNSLLPTSVLSKDPGVRAPASKNHLTFHIQSAKPHRIELGHHPHFFGFRHYNSIVAASWENCWYGRQSKEGVHHAPPPSCRSSSVRSTIRRRGSSRPFSFMPIVVVVVVVVKLTWLIAVVVVARVVRYCRSRQALLRFCGESS